MYIYLHCKLNYFCHVTLIYKWDELYATTRFWTTVDTWQALVNYCAFMSPKCRALGEKHVHVVVPQTQVRWSTLPGNICIVLISVLGFFQQYFLIDTTRRLLENVFLGPTTVQNSKRKSLQAVSRQSYLLYCCMTCSCRRNYWWLITGVCT